MCFLVNIAKLFDSKPPVSYVNLLFIIKRSNVGWFLLKRVDLDIVRVIYTLLVETISTLFYWLTCRNQKLVQNKPLQQRLFDLIFLIFFDILIANISWTVAQTPIRHIIFWKTIIKTFRSMYVNCFNTEVPGSGQHKIAENALFWTI